MKTPVSKRLRPVVWTIAGSDSGGGAGIQADLKTIQALGGHGCSIVTALTAQNSRGVSAISTPDSEFFHAQWTALETDLKPQAIKVGMIGSETVARNLAQRLPSVNCPIVVDPVLIASSGDSLAQSGVADILKNEIFPHASLVTPNLTEMETLAGSDIEKAAEQFLKWGAKSVLIKGGHSNSREATDLWTDGVRREYFSCPRLDREAHGTGCSLSSAIATGLAMGLDMVDSIIQAKTFVSAALRNCEKIGSGFAFLDFTQSQISAEDFPFLHTYRGKSFEKLDHRVGFYPIVDSVEWIEKLAKLGVKTMQLRVKSKTEPLDRLVHEAAALGHRYQLQLFINDYWELAITSQAYGVHLGQEDLATADLNAIQRAGLRLGISTHSHYEMAFAKSIRPSYIAIGPIYPTTLKAMKFAPQGLERLGAWSKYFDCPVVAIGGISLERAPAVLECGVDGISVVSDISQGFESTETRVAKWLSLIRY